ncbi:MAG: hypothetical protein F4Y27_07625 [Acidimicrobiaceae bacterium]|nr:hypothetical protein [Acidimicrobiaceae bacterium]MXW60347.1 hypothetical protein [Acidimicrobiaceae bacterium]MXW75817.1 hypothetical protein [Acidimicrobiaceae bacterium]MYA74528.1 hypothetical protein [Acidimicrobiaceae bacterium]MYC43136.1 hypothetical protein [Acidimicrobiaceae bacterium]
MARNAVRSFTNFLRLLRGMPPTRTGVSTTGAKQAREALHVRGPGGTAGAFSGTSSTDSHLGKAIASGHQEKVYGDPASKNRVVGYGGHAPKYRKKSSGFVTVVLVLLFLGIILSEFL